MTTAVPPRIRQQCSYQTPILHEQCRQERILDGRLCIFHLPFDHPEKVAFQKHLASYLCALMTKAGDKATAEFAKNYPGNWVFRMRDRALYDHYIADMIHPSWNFRGFIFPPTDYGFMDFVFADADFYDAVFFGPADFLMAKFTGHADFMDAEFHGDACFGAARFGLCRFSGVTFHGAGDFHHARFGSTVFAGAKFLHTADFSYTQFDKAPAFRGVDFRGRVDFYETKLPGVDGETTARYIRRKVEQHGSYADAGDIYIVEMEFRRKRFAWRRAFFARLVMELYLHISRYGESPSRALGWLLALLLVAGVLYPFVGFRFAPNDEVRLRFVFASDRLGSTALAFGKSFLFSLANVVPGYFRFQVFSATSGAATAISVIQGALSVVVLALFLLALRRRFSR